MPNPFALGGTWFRGNLHTHTTESDGAHSPQEMVELYADQGYDFLAITDHRQVTDLNGLDDRGLLLIPGIEMNGGRSDVQGPYHVVAIGARRPMQVEPGQKSIDQLIEYGSSNAELVFIAHPSYSSLTVTDLLDLDGCLGIEVYNATCHYSIGRGESATQWDDLLARGKRAWGLAVDDAHLKHGYRDVGVGHVMVKAAECTHDGIIAALKAGQFYSSNGPQIHNIERDGDRVLVECSPCWEVRVICPMPGRGMTTHRTDRKPPFTSVEFELRPETDPIRVECLDEVGNKAWSNPLWLDE